jgi:hypothetical protein
MVEVSQGGDLGAPYIPILTRFNPSTETSVTVFLTAHSHNPED